MVVRCSQLNEELVTTGRLDVRRGTLSALPYADKSFDKIVSINTLYFWDYPGEELREVRRVLKPGGRLFLGLRTKTVLQTKPQFQYGFTLYEAADVERLLRSAGFEEIGHVHRMEPEGTFDALVVFGTAY
jgi:SAM-dependent methyltransferase